jgi:hypothetical protein
MTLDQTATLTFLITNVGDSASASDTISFVNDDASLAVQGPATRSLPSLAAGASTTVNWQVQAMSPSVATSNGGSFQVMTSISGQSAALEDQVSVASG